MHSAVLRKESSFTYPMAELEGREVEVGESSDTHAPESPELERRKKKRRKIDISSPSRWDRLHRGCLELLQELDDLEKAVEEEHLRRNWFTGVRIFLNRPIHSK